MEVLNLIRTQQAGAQHPLLDGLAGVDPRPPLLKHQGRLIGADQPELHAEPQHRLISVDRWVHFPNSAQRASPSRGRKILWALIFRSISVRSAAASMSEKTRGTSRRRMASTASGNSAKVMRG